MEPDAKLLGKRAAKAATWGYAGMLGKLAVQLGSQVILARVLGPESYGIFAIGSLVVGIAAYFADAGIGSALIQRAHASREEIVLVQSYQWLAGLVVAAVIALGAPIIADFFNEPRAVAVLRAMAVIPLLSAFASVPSNLLRRELDYRTLQIAQFSGYVFGYLLVGLPLAFAGQGVWALASAWIAQSVLTCVLLFRAQPPSLKFRLRTSASGEVLRFGLNALLSNISTWAGLNADRVIVGRYFSTTSLGLYNAAGNLLSTAVTQILSTLQSVLFSAGARVSNDMGLIRAAFLGLVEIGGLVVFPLFLSIATIPDIFLGAVYGEKWSSGAALLTPISLAMCMYGLSGMVTPLFWSLGRVDIEGRLQAISTVMLVGCGLVAAQAGSLSAVAWTVTACVTLRTIVTVAWLAKLIAVSPSQVLRAIVPSLMVGMVGALTAHLVKLQMASPSTSSVAYLLAQCAAAAIATVSCVTIIMGKIGFFPSLTALVRRAVVF